MPLQEQIKISSDTKNLLDNLKIVELDTYDAVIQRLILAAAEQMTDINDETKNILSNQLQKFKEGRVKSFNEVLKEFKHKKGVTSNKGGMDGKQGRNEGIRKKSYPRGDDDVMGS